MSKLVKINTPIGVYGLPARVVALNMADYYSQSEYDAVKRGELFDEEFKNAMNDSDALVDWLMNNMDFEEIKLYLVKIEDRPQPSIKSLWKELTADEFSVV